MPRRSILSAAERESLLALPDAKDELIRHYTFNDTDLAIIRQHRGPTNRLGFAVQLCYLRFPGIILGVDQTPFPPLLRIVAAQLKVPVESWDEYGLREQTRREHLVELQTVFGFKPFTMSHYRQAVHIRDETYSTALAERVNAQFRQPFAENWGDGTTSSSDGQRFKAGGKAESTGHIHPKYGGEPGRMFYTHISDQYAPFSAKVVNVGVRDSTYVLDGLLYHESDLRIEEH